MVSSSKYCLGSLKEHTTYEAEGVGVILALDLLQKVRGVRSATIRLDNQGVIQSIEHIQARPGQRVLNTIHDLANYVTNPSRRHHMLLSITWISGHDDVEGNELADKEAKLATEDGSSEMHLLPPFLANDAMPQSLSATQQVFKEELARRWKEKWSKSLRFTCMHNIDPSLPSKKYRNLANTLMRAQASLLTQLRSGHIPLNSHLHRIRKTTSPLCPNCNRSDETVHHYLFECRAHEHARAELSRKLRRDAKSIRILLNTEKGIHAVLQYVTSTKRLKSIFGDVPPPPSNP